VGVGILTVYFARQDEERHALRELARQGFRRMAGGVITLERELVKHQVVVRMGIRSRCWRLRLKMAALPDTLLPSA